MEAHQTEDKPRKYKPIHIPTEKWASFGLDFAHDDPKAKFLQSKLSKNHSVQICYRSNTFKNLIKAERSFFAHDAGTIHETAAIMIDDDIFVKQRNPFVYLSAKAFQSLNWSKNKSQQPFWAAAWLAEMVLSSSQILAAATPAFSLEGAPRFDPPSYIIADRDDNSILIFCWIRHAGSMVPRNTYVRHCYRFSATGHYQDTIHHFSLHFATDLMDSAILSGPNWAADVEEPAAAPPLRAMVTSNIMTMGPRGSVKSRSPIVAPTDSAPTRRPITPGTEWNLPAYKLPIAQEHDDLETLDQMEAREAAEAQRVAAEKEEAERAIREAEQREREVKEREEREKQEKFTNNLKRYFNILAEENEKDQIVAWVSSDIWARDAVTAVQSGNAVLGESKMFPKLYVIIMKPKERSDPGERKGFIWNYKYRNLLGYGSIPTEPILDAAGWKNATQERKEELMIEMIGVMYGGYQHGPFLEEPTAAFNLPGAPPFTKPFVLLRKRYFVYWVHVWTRLESSYGSTGYERVCYGFAGESAGLQGLWHNRFVGFRTNSAETEMLTPPQWSHYEYKVDDKNPPFDGKEETWPEWKKEMEC